MTAPSIGTAAGRTYSTIQSWEDDAPATLTAPWIGECYNDSEFAASGTIVTFQGTTTSSTNYIELRCAAGESFRDNANAQTNALAYNRINGVGLKCSGAYSPAIQISCANVKLTGLQIQHTNASNRNCISGDGSSSGAIIESCILEQLGTGVAGSVRGGTWRNCLVVQRASNSSGGISVDYVVGTTGIYNCTIVRVSDKTAGGSAVLASSGSTPVKNCAFFGFTSVANNNGRFSFTTGATDVASPPTGVTGSLTYGSEFQNTLDATRDFRLKSGASLIDAGTTDSTNAANDIVGTSRPQGSSYDIGAWEFVSTSSTTTLTATAFDNTNAFGTAVITLDLQAAAFDNVNQFGNAAVSAGATQLAATAFDNVNAFDTAKLTLGLKAAAFDNASAFDSATLTLSLSATAFAETNLFGTTSITLDLAATAFDNTNAFGAATVSFVSQHLTATPFVNTNAFDTAKITLELSASPFNNTNSFGTGGSLFDGTLRPAAFLNINQFGAAQVIVKPLEALDPLPPSQFVPTLDPYFLQWLQTNFQIIKDRLGI